MRGEYAAEEINIFLSEAARDDRPMDALYDELRKVGVQLPELVGKTFEVGVDAANGAVLENKAEGRNPD